MKRELYPASWKDIQAAVRERATPDGEQRPRCEQCGKQHGKLRKNRAGYMIPDWLHTVHIHGTPLQSCDPSDYLCLCPRCHMVYDRQANELGWVSEHRDGYATTTTGTLVDTLAT